MTQHQKAQQLAKTYYDFLISRSYNPYRSWNAAMSRFKQEMQKDMFINFEDLNMMQSIPYIDFQKLLFKQHKNTCEIWLANKDNSVQVLRHHKSGMHYMYANGKLLFKDLNADVIALYFKKEMIKRGEKA